MSKRELDRRKKTERLEAKCHERGLPVTVQRRVIFDALLDRQDHPTIDQVDDVKSRIPGVSRTTAYRTLETLAELGVAKKTSHFVAVARFDGNMEHHHYLVCVRCDKVVDFADPALSGLPLPDARRTGFEIVDFSVYFEGLCPECKKRSPKSIGSKGRKRKQSDNPIKRNLKKEDNYGEFKRYEESRKSKGSICRRVPS